MSVIVLGCGLFGSSAALHLAPRTEVTVVGPEETGEDGAAHPLAGAHADEGRILAELSLDPIWIELVRRTRQAIDALDPALMRACGGLTILPGDRSDYLDAAIAVRDWLGLNIGPLGDRQAAARFPALHLPAGCLLLLEETAGHFSPRRYVRLATERAAAHGAMVVRQAAVRLSLTGTGVAVTLGDGSELRAAKALIATGTYAIDASVFELDAALRVKSETAVLAEVAPEDVPGGFPCLMAESARSELGEVYLVPPVRYPGGRWYIKGGANTIADRWLPGPDELHRWRSGGEPAHVGALRDELSGLLGGVRVRSWVTYRCAELYTAHGRPYIDEVVPGRVVLAAGGNGHGAQVASQVGALAADLLLTGTWPDEVPREPFRIVPAAGRWHGAELLCDRRPAG